MSDNSKAANGRPPLQRIRDQLDRLVEQPSGMVDLGHALVGSNTPADEQACEACQAFLPEYIEAELNGEPVRRRFPAVARHLELCASCGETYVDLMELALASEEGVLPVLTPMPAVDLGFLPRLTPAEQMRQIVEQLAAEVARRVDATILPDLPAAGRALFDRIREMGEGFQLRREPALALGFGAELTPELLTVFASYSATRQLLEGFSIEELESELARDLPSPKLQKRVRSVVQAAGMQRREAKQWAKEYVAQAQAHKTELLAVARQLAQDE